MTRRAPEGGPVVRDRRWRQTAVRPFQVGFPEADLADLRRRIEATRWPERETVADDSQAGFFEAKPISIPYAISVFPDELFQAPRSWAERAYPDNLIHYNRFDRGGHFAAWEQPALFCGEMRTAFRSLRGAGA